MTEHDLINESHRAACAECLAAWAELEAISAEARALPQLTPSRDLWAGIEARIGGAAVVRQDDAATARAAASPALSRAERRWFMRPAVRTAAAAALLVMATSAGTWRVATDDDGLARVDVASAPSDSETAIREALTDAPDGSPRYTQASYETDFAAMDLEIRTMQTLLNERRAELDTNTVAVLERSITLIDQAIAESRAALMKDPASQFLAAQLARSYTTKLTLLRSTATMPVGD